MTPDQILAIVIFLGMFICIVLEKWHRYISALADAVIIVVLVFRNVDGIMWVLNFKEIFHPSFWITSSLKDEVSHGVNWQTIIFIGGMMVMIAGMERVGFFRWLCLYAARLVGCRIMPLLKSFAALRPTKKLFATGLVCLLWANTPMPGLADTSPPQTAGVPIPDGQIDKAIASLDAIASDVLKRSGIPGMAIAVVRDGKTVYAKGSGPLHTHL